MSATAKNVPCALIGLGEHGGTTLLPLLAANPRLDLRAVCDRDPRSAPVAGGLPRPWRVYRNHEELLEQESVEAVFVACPPLAHDLIVPAALMRGRDVFVEKPPASDRQRLEAAVRLADQHRRVTMVGFNFRFATAFQEFRRCVEAPDFGQPAAFIIDYAASWPRGPRWHLSGVIESFVMTHLVHVLDLVMVLAPGADLSGCEVKTFGATGLLLLAQFTTPDGVTVVVNASNLAPRFSFTIRAFSESSMSVVQEGFSRVKVLRGGTPRTGWGDRWESGVFGGGSSDTGYAGEINAFADAVYNHRPLTPDLRDALRVYELLEQVRDRLPRAR